MLHVLEACVEDELGPNSCIINIGEEKRKQMVLF